MKTEKTKIEILDDVVDHVKKQGGVAYSEEDGMCLYTTKDGKTCGHSMAINPTKRKLLKGELSAKTVIDKYGDNIHLKKYRGHSDDFWSEVQNFHDGGNWNEDGTISEVGDAVLSEIKNEYS